MTADNFEPITFRLQRDGFNVAECERSGQLTCIGTEDFLARLMASGTLKGDLFRFTIRRLVDRARAAVSKEVLVLVVRGLLNKQIASKLGLSEATVKMHRGHVTAKDAKQVTR